jgi:hypothetical protein
MKVNFTTHQSREKLMQIVDNYLKTKQKNFQNHLFFQELKKQNSFLKTMEFAPRLTFWAMAFQDILRLLPPKVKSKELRRIATHHKIEDSGHDQWFLQDLAFLDRDKVYDIPWLFSKENSQVRDCVYQIISEAFTLNNDHSRILLILILESTGHIFFEEISNFAKRAGYDEHLKYFSSYHLEVEQSHAIFEADLEKALFSIELNKEERQEAYELIDRVYQQFIIMFDYFNNYIISESNKMPITTENQVA